MDRAYLHGRIKRPRLRHVVEAFGVVMLNFLRSHYSVTESLVEAYDADIKQNKTANC